MAFGKTSRIATLPTVGLVVWVLLAVGSSLAWAGKPECFRADAHDIGVALRVLDELENERQWDAAQRQLRAVLLLARHPCRDDLRLRGCHLWKASAALAQAHVCYKHASLAATRSSAAALALYFSGTVEAELGHTDEARQTMHGLLMRYPSTHASHRALVWLRAERRRKGGAIAEVQTLLAMASALATIQPPQKSALLRAEALVQAGRVLLVELDNPTDAERILAQGVAAGRDSVWGDDALFWHAKACFALAQHARSLRILQTLLDGGEFPWPVGSKGSVYYDDALWLRGQVLSAMGDIDAAIVAYQDLQEQLPRSLLSDDAAFAAACLQKKRGDASALRAFAERFPTSRYVHGRCEEVEQRD